MTPTALLLLAAAVAVVRSRRAPDLVSAARALCALLILDVYHHACRPLLDAWRAGVALSSAEVLALRFDAWIVAGGWCAVIVWLLSGTASTMLTFATTGRPSNNGFPWLASFVLYGVSSVIIARLWPAAWTSLLIASRFVVGALAWHAARARSGSGEVDRRSSASLSIGQIIAACQVGAAAFLWSRWGDVTLAT